MARIKRAVAAKKKRRTVMHRAKGYYYRFQPGQHIPI